MQRILAVETTTDVCSVALGIAREAGVEWVVESRIAPREHNRLVLSLIDGVLDAAGVVRAELSGIAFSAGPGSFTGVRIGASVAQGIALGLDLPVSAVASSEALAWGMAALGVAGEGRRTLRRHSRPGWRYEAVYAFGNGGVRCVQFDQLVAGSGPCDDQRIAMSAQFVGMAALARQDLAVPAERALPVYVEGDTPWRPAT